MSEVSNFADRLDLFFGATSDALCRVYARLEGPGRSGELQGELQLTGTLTGPRCAYAQTLPATFSFVDRGPGSSLLAETLVPEPCFWSPQMPHLYDADLQLRDGDRVLARAKRMFGIRTLGAAGRTLVYAGKNWVLRGVVADELPQTDLAAWRDAESAMCVRNPSDALCDTASRVGVLLVAELETPDLGEIRRLSRWPAVAIVSLPPAATLARQGLAPNMILAERFATGQPIEPASWANAVVVEVDERGAAASGIAASPIPVIAIRPAGKLPNVADGRSQCDRLQRDLSQHGQLAGYIV